MQGISRSDSNASKNTKKEDPTKDLSPVEKLLYNAGPIRPDGSDKFFGLENVRACSWEVQFTYYRTLTTVCMLVWKHLVSRPLENRRRPLPSMLTAILATATRSSRRSTTRSIFAKMS